MAFNNKDGVNEINDDGTFVVTGNNRFPTSADLPLGAAAGYLAYVQSSETLQLNVGGGSWRTFQTRAIDYKNEVILEQGTIGGGFDGSTVFTAITKIHYASDAPIQILPALLFPTRNGGQHSTYLYAYYYQGWADNSLTAGNSSCKQDWATMTVSIINSRTNISGGNLNSTQPGPKQQNTLGVLMQGTTSCYLTFSTDSWTNGGYSSGLVDETNGYATFGGTYGYTNGNGSSGHVYKLNWASLQWSSDSSNTGSYRAPAKALNSKWDKWYQGGPTSAISVYNNVTKSFSSVSSAPTTFQDQETSMGQDWGYWSGYSAGSYQSTIFKTDYASNITSVVKRGSFNYGHSGGSGCWGPIP